MKRCYSMNILSLIIGWNSSIYFIKLELVLKRILFFWKKQWQSWYWNIFLLSKHCEWVGQLWSCRTGNPEISFLMPPMIKTQNSLRNEWLAKATVSMFKIFFIWSCFQTDLKASAQSTVSAEVLKNHFPRMVVMDWKKTCVYPTPP